MNRILLDGGSAVNILTLRMLKELDIPVEELLQSRLIIHSFNQGGQRVVCAIRLDLQNKEMTSSLLLNIMDCKTS